MKSIPNESTEQNGSAIQTEDQMETIPEDDISHRPRGKRYVGESSGFWLEWKQTGALKIFQA